MNHRTYFQRFQLNVEQYGEILGADALGLKKMGDAQPCYDLEGDKISLINTLKAHSVDTSFLDNYKEDNVYIEVKSKLVYTNTGKASVIHCNSNKIYGVNRSNKKQKPMSHMLIVLVEPGFRANLNKKDKTNAEEGHIELAVLLSNTEVVNILKKTKKGGLYISVNMVRNGNYVALTSMLNNASIKEF